MLRKDRLKHILHYLEIYNEVSINQLAEEFKISPITMRIDIRYLAEQGQVTRKHGAVSLLKNNMFLGGTIDVRKFQGNSLKTQLLSLASHQITSGNTIFLDDSTTVAHIIPFLKNISGLTVITHSIEAIIQLKQYSHIHTIGLGGSLSAIDSAFIGPSVLKQLDEFTIDLVFLGCWSLNIPHHSTETSYSSSIIKQRAVERGKKTILILTSNKFSNQHGMPTISWEDIDLIITDMPPRNIPIDKPLIVL